MKSEIIFILIITFCGLVYQVDGDDDDECDLTLSGFLFTFTDSNITIQWEPRNQTVCLVEYHLTVNDEEFGIIKDIILEENSTTLDPMSPCIQYDVGLRAINKAFPDEEGPLMSLTILIFSKAQVAPTLQLLDIQATSINMTWTLEGDANRCPLKSFYVEGPYFNETVPLQDSLDRTSVPVQIESLRPNSMYYFKVYVENSGGMSQATQLAVQTLELTDN